MIDKLYHDKIINTDIFADPLHEGLAERGT